MKNDLLAIKTIPVLINLQWFSDADDNPEDNPDRIYDPTEHKLRQLREEGQVAKSQELVGALGLLLPAVLLLFLAPSMLRTCMEMVRFYFSRAVELDPVKDELIVSIFFNYFLRLATPVLAVAIVAALASNIVQVGWQFTTKPITPDLDKALPKIGKYFKRIFSQDGFWDFGKSIIKMLIIAGVSFTLIFLEIDKLLNLQKATLWTGLSTVSSIAIRMLILAAILLLVLAIPDYFFQRKRFLDKNKMTKYEFKKEMKEQEGDPEIQHKIRSRFRMLLKQNIAVEVPKADVVITNPKHLAVAIRADPVGPVIVAMGEENIAAKIREIAESAGVPIYEHKPFARFLYNNMDIGQVVPKEYWETVITILSKVWYLNEARGRRLA